MAESPLATVLIFTLVAEGNEGLQLLLQPAPVMVSKVGILAAGGLGSLFGRGLAGAEQGVNVGASMWIKRHLFP